MANAIVEFKGRRYEVTAWRSPQEGEWFLNPCGNMPCTTTSTYPGDERRHILRPLPAPATFTADESGKGRRKRGPCLCGCGVTYYGGDLRKGPDRRVDWETRSALVHARPIGTENKQVFRDGYQRGKARGQRERGDG